MVQYLTGEAVIIADWLLLGCAYVLVSIRLWFRLIYQRRSLTSSDSFLLFAAGLVMAVMVIFQQAYFHGAMVKGNRKAPTAQVKKYAFASVLLYHTTIYSTKFSILAFYAKLFPQTSPNLRRSCFTAMGYTCVCYLVAMFLAIFWCGPKVSRNFQVGPGSCSIWDYKLFKINFAMNISSDIIIFVLPFPLLATLNLARRQVIALCVTFGLGLITMIVSVCRCIALLHNAFLPLYVWSMAEMCTAIMVSSLPSLRPLLRNSRRFIATASPPGSGEKRASPRLCKPRSQHKPPTIGSGVQNPSGEGHVRNLSDDGTASDIELIHVHMKLGEKLPDEQTENLQIHHDQNHRRSGRSVETFETAQQNRRTDWV